MTKDRNLLLASFSHASQHGSRQFCLLKAYPVFFEAVVQERHGKLQKCFYKETAILQKRGEWTRRQISIPLQRTITKAMRHSFKLPQRLFSLRKTLYSCGHSSGIYRISKESHFNHCKERLERQGLITVHIPCFIH